MRDQILAALAEIEANQQVRIVFACESGSRAWGFASTDSDYDVRFIYSHQPHWYLEIDERRDVIERQLPGDLDVSGWEIRKALRLFRKCNPPLMEWLRSPIIYRQDESFVEALRSVPWLPSGESKGDWDFSPLRCIKHYYSMARGNVRNYFEQDLVPLKKYLYVLRPILACMWIERKLSLPPVAFEQLVNGLVTDDELFQAIGRLLDLKKAGTEVGKGAKIPAIQAFIEREFERLADVRNLSDREPDTAQLNRLFAETVGFASSGA